MLEHAQEKLRDTAIVLVDPSLPVPACCLQGARAEPHMLREVLDYQSVRLYLVVSRKPSPSDVVLESWHLEVGKVGHAMEAVGCICPVHVRPEATDPRIAQLNRRVPRLKLLVVRQEVLHFGGLASHIHALKNLRICFVSLRFSDVTVVIVRLAVALDARGSHALSV